MVALCFSQVLSVIGGRFIELGIPWLLLATNHRADSTAIMAIVPLATAMSALPIGRWAQRTRLPQVPSQAELVQGAIFLTLVVLMLTGALGPIAVPGLVIALTLVAILGTVTRITLTPKIRSVFGRDAMIRVSNYLEGSDALGTIMGPVLAGLVFSTWGGTGIFGVLVILFLGSGVGLRILGGHHAGTNVRSLRDAEPVSLFESLRMLIAPPLLTLSVIDWIANFVSIAVVLDMVLIIARHLHLPDMATGVAFTLAGIGNFVVVAILDRLQSSRHFHPVKTLFIASGVSALGSLMLLTSVTYYGLAMGYVVLDGGMAGVFVMSGAMRNMVTPTDKIVAMRTGITFSNQVVRGIGSLLPGLLFAWWQGRTLLGLITLCGLALLGLVWYGRSALSEIIVKEGAMQQ